MSENALITQDITMTISNVSRRTTASVSDTHPASSSRTNGSSPPPRFQILFSLIYTTSTVKYNTFKYNTNNANLSNLAHFQLYKI